MQITWFKSSFGATITVQEMCVLNAAAVNTQRHDAFESEVTPETVKLGFSGSLPKYNHMSTGTAKLYNYMQLLNS